MDTPQNSERKSLLKNALQALDEMQARLEAAERRRHEPVAVIGMSCRFPGAAGGPGDFWELLRSGGDAVGLPPPGRWDLEAYNRLVPDLQVAWYGGYLEGIDQFDPGFFGISPREAASLDPQQRLVLEVSWEALENAALPPEKLAGSQTGVFIGLTTNDYAQLLRAGGPTRMDAYAATGGALNAAAGRLAYLLDLRGPSLVLDTACSSSLVAIHQAMRSLRVGESRVALAGGVNAILTPEPFIAFARWGMMAPDGRCKTFDARADGFVRGEGCGMLVLKLLSDALADGDPILAVLRGSAVNQDGRSSGLTVPNGRAQQAVIRQALQDAQVSPAQVSYVEAHGTGTALGDPIEIEALGAVYGDGRGPEDALAIGSVKTNIGHLESASGVAGLIKVILSLQHETLPPHLHLQERSPRIPWPDFPIEIPTAPVPWRRGERPRLAGVSSFGFSGTNAHLIVSEAPLPEPPASEPARPVQVLCLSARTEPALRQLAGRYAGALSDPDAPSLADAAFTAHTGRAHFSHRLAVSAADNEGAAAALEAFARGESAGALRAGTVFKGDGPRLAFLFTGQGAQYAGMGRRLYQTESVFRAELDRCAELLDPYLERPLLEVLFSADGPESLLHHTAYTQPALFALEWSLASLWASWGARPYAVLGHSVGEYAAACLAGVFSLEDGLRLIAARARLMGALPAGGGMAALLAGEAQAAGYLAPYAGRLSIAALNGPENTVVSGDLDALDELLAELAGRGVQARRLTVSGAFHSHRMDPILEPFLEEARRVRLSAPSLALISNLSGEPAGEEVCSPEYWMNHIRRPVQFARGMASLERLGCNVFLEIGPDPTLVRMGRRCLQDPERPRLWLASLRKDGEDWEALGEALAGLYVAGLPVDWGAFDRAGGRRKVSLPTYPFQHVRCWLEDGPAPAALPAGEGPFQLEPLEVAGEPDLHLWQGKVSLDALPYLGDHRIQEAAVLPATAYIELAVEAATRLFGAGPLKLKDFENLAMLVLRPGEAHRLQVSLQLQGGLARFRIYSRPEGQGARAWKLHVTGTVQPLAEADLAGRPDLASFESIRARAGLETAGPEFYRAQAQKGNQWGPAFQGLLHAWQGTGEAAAEVRAAATIRGELERYTLHPALADAGEHVLLAALPGGEAAQGKAGAFVGGGVEEIRVYRELRGEKFFACARLRQDGARAENILYGDVALFDEHGALVSETLGTKLWYLEPGAGALQPEGPEEWFYQVSWQPQELPGVSEEARAPGCWLVLCDRQGVGEALAERLRAAGGRTLIAAWDSARGEAGEAACRVRPAVREDFDWLLEQAASRFQGHLDGIVYLWSLDVPRMGEAALPEVERAQELTAAALLHLAQALGACKLQGERRLALVTRGVQALPGSPAPVEALQAPVWGFGRSLAAELPEFWGALIDLDPGEDGVRSAGRLFQELLHPSREDQLAYRDGRRYAARLDRLPLPDPGPEVQCRPEAAYLITGGLGGLGLAAAGWLAERGARNLVLLGRSPLPPRETWEALPEGSPQARRVSAVRALEGCGVTVITAAVDVSDAEALERFFEQYERGGNPPLRGVIHAAGIPLYSPLGEHSLEEMRAVLQPKLLGGWLLHRHFEHRPLDFFILYSSASALLSSPLIASYAAGNAFLDALAHFRRAAGLPGLSLNWGFWSEVGMAADFAGREAGPGDSPVGRSLSPRQGLRALELSLRAGFTQAAVIPTDWAQWGERYAGYASSPYLERLVGPARPGTGLQPAAQSDAETRLPQAEAAGGPGVSTFDEIAAVLRMAPGALPLDEPLNQLGFDSLMALELKSRLERRWNVSLPLIKILEGPTPSELHAYLLAQAGLSTEASDTTSARAPIASAEQGREAQLEGGEPPEAGDGAAFPLSYNQRSMWFMNRLAPQSTAYTVAFAARIRSRVDVEAMKRALGRLIERHPALRTTFLSRGEEPAQVVHASLEVPFEQVQAHGWDDGRLFDAVYGAYCSPVDLERGPVMRAHLFTRAEDEHVFLLSGHHIAADGWSIGLLLRDFQAFYRAETAGDAPDLPPLNHSYLDYVRWQTALLEGPQGEDLRWYWLQAFSDDLPPLALPVDHPYPPVQTLRGASLDFELDEALSKQLQAFCLAEGVTPYMLLLSAYISLLHAWSGQEDIVVGTPAAGRSRPEFENVVGIFINMLPIRARCTEGLTFRELLQQVRLAALGALEHQDYPFSRLVEDLPRQRLVGRSPLFQVAFDFQRLERYGAIAPLFLPSSGERAVELAGLALEPYPFPQQEGQFELGLQVVEGEDRLYGVIKYNSDLFEKETISRLRAGFVKLLEATVAHPDEKLNHLSVQVKNMDLEHFLTHLRKLDVRLWVEEGRLRANAPAGQLTPDLRAEIGRRKEEIIAYLESSASGAVLPLPPLQRVSRQGPLPLSFSQQRLWFLYHLEPHNTAYNIPSAIRLIGRLDIAAIERSFSEIVRRHEVLRTSYRMDGGQPVQVISPPVPLPLRQVDLSDLPESQREARAFEILRQEFQRPFDLSCDVLLRTLLVRLGPEEYIVSVVTHHIASDAWSLGVMTRELGDLYAAFSAGKPSPLPELPVQYADYAAWQRLPQQARRLESQLSYWKEKLAGPLPVIDLPADHPRPPFQSFKGARERFDMPPDLLASLRAFSNREGVTLFMTMMAAFKVLLHRFTGQDDILIGSPVAGRTLVELEPLIGFFTNNLVLRTDLSGEPTFRELLRRVRATTLEAYANQEVPFQRLVDALQSERDMSRMPFFQILFSMQNVPLEKNEMEGITWKPVEVDAGVARFDLTLEVWELPDEGMRFYAEYSTDLFESASIHRLMAHYLRILAQVVEQPETPITLLDLMPASERELVLETWNATATAWPPGETLQELFAEQVARTPQAVALVYEDETLTYAELDRRAGLLAGYLQSIDIGPESLAAVFMERSADLLVALLGVLKAGGAYLPLDPGFPRDRLEFMLQDSGARVLITQERLRESLPSFSGSMVVLDTDWETIAAAPPLALSRPGRAEDLAYVIYTSGSTGRPKGVQVLQRGLVNFLRSMQREPGILPEDILLSVTTPSFDISGLEFYLPLISGARVVVAPKEAVADAQKLMRLMESSGATVMQATPATWRLLLNAGWQGNPRLKVLCGGEALPPELAAQLFTRCASLWNLYGPTETTIWSTLSRVGGPQEPITIGKPIANTQVYILDQRLRPVPVGVPGELLIGGDGLARGYLNRPELTAEKFIPHPFRPGERLYRTGDLARFRPDGCLEYLGRLDHQVKVRGFRIELGEIEANLEALPEVRQAVVVVREDTPGDKRLVAYVIPQGPSNPAPGELRAALRESLPEYMLPSTFVFLNEFPLTPNGKVDRRRLPAPEGQRPELETTYVAPRNPIERRLAEIWQEVLNLKQVGVNDTFFDLGGHSILLVQAHHRICQAFDTDLTVAQMFQYPTIASIARYLSRSKESQVSLGGIQERILKQQRMLDRRRERLEPGETPAPRDEADQSKQKENL